MQNPADPVGRPVSIRRFLRHLASRIARLQALLHERPLAALGGVVALTVFLGAGTLSLSIDNRTSSWLAGGDSGGGEFPGSRQEFFLLVYPAGDGGAESPAFLELDAALARQVAALPGVARVECVSGILARLDRRSLAELGAGVAFLEDNLLFDGGRTAVQRAWLQANALPRDVLDHLESTLDSLPVRPTIVGPAAFNAHLDRLSRQESERAIPLGLLSALLVLTLALRSVRRALPLMLVSMLGVFWYLGVAGWLGVRYNFLTVNVPILAFVIALALGVHPYSAWLGRRRPGATATWKTVAAAALRTAPACLLAALTTAIGFLSLTLSRVQAVREFGRQAALAIFVVYVCGVLVLPLALRWRVVAKPVDSRRRWNWDALADRISRWSRPIRWIAAAVLLGSIVTLTQLSTENDSFDFFPAEHPFRDDCARLEGEIHGTAPLEYRVELRGPVWEAAHLRELESTVAAMEEAAGGRRSVSVLDFVRMASALQAGGAPGSYRVPEETWRLQLGLTAVRLVPEVEEHFVAPGGRVCRVILPLDNLPTAEFGAVQRRVEAAVAARTGVDLRPMGLIHALVTLQAHTLDEQILSLGLATVGIAVLVGVALGSIAWCGLAWLVLMLPLVVTGGILVLLDLRLDLTTAMVASVAIGLAVDDTIHFLWDFRQHGGTPCQRLALTLSRVGRPIVLTTLVLVAGFCALGLAGFPPIARFGLLTAITLALSVLVHLTVLPAILGLERRSGGARGDSRPIRV